MLAVFQAFPITCDRIEVKNARAFNPVESAPISLQNSTVCIIQMDYPRDLRVEFEADLHVGYEASHFLFFPHATN